jgi:sporulation protein YlmC with PRC-barrel domain
MKNMPAIPRTVTSTLVAAGLCAAAWNVSAADAGSQPSTRPADRIPGTNVERDHLTNKDTNSTMTSMTLVSTEKLLGKEVQDSQGDDVGEITALAVDLSSGKAPIAVVEVGGVIGVGASKIAVPTHLLQCSTDADGDEVVTINASKEELKSAAKEPTGSWIGINHAEWSEGIDGFYGDLHSSKSTMHHSPQSLPGTPQGDSLRNKY